METGLGLITVSALAMLVMEGIKWFLTKIGAKPEAGFSTAFYVIGLPVLNALVPFPMAWLGIPVEAPTLGMGWLDLVKYIVIAVLGAVISLVLYKDGVKPLKDKAEELQFMKG
jgi:hypothetical protein